MNLFSVSLRNLRMRAVSTVLTVLSIALGVGLLAALWLLIGETDRRYHASLAGYKAVVGPKEGSPLSLVLNTVFNLGVSNGIVPFSVYRDLHGRRGLRYVIPQARGDSFGGFPVIGTTDEMFSEFQRGEAGTLQMAGGRAFRFSHDEFLAFSDDLAEGRISGHRMLAAESHGDGEARSLAYVRREAVIGSEVARRLDLAVGSRIVPVHGLEENVGSHLHEEAACEVVGVLAATQTPIDRSVFIPLSVFLAMEGHGDAVREVDGRKQVVLSALIVDPIARLGPLTLQREFRTRADAQVAFTVTEVGELLRIVGDATQVLRVVAWLVLVVAAVSVLVSLYNTMNERRREIAIMRALGARRAQILRVILQEAVVISLVGACLGVVLCHLAVLLLGGWITDKASIDVEWARFSWDEIELILLAGVLGGIAGVLPAIKGSATPVADNLAPTS